MKKIIWLALFAVSAIQASAQELFVTTTDSVRLYVRTAGSGPACLYLHGGPGAGALWLERFYGDFLERHFRMVYLDQRGTGRSSSPADGNYSIERMTRDFEEVRTALGIGRWLTLGHSFGGILQTDYAVRYPKPQLGLMMVNCTLCMEDSFRGGWIPRTCVLLGDEARRVWADESVPLARRLESVARTLNGKGLQWKLAYASPESEERMNATYAEIPSFNNDLSGAALHAKDYWTDYRPASALVRLPVLFFCGTEDWCVGPKHYEGVRFPRMLLRRSRVGHIPFLENRADLDRAICRYIKKYGFGRCDR